MILNRVMGQTENRVTRVFGRGTPVLVTAVLFGLAWASIAPLTTRGAMSSSDSIGYVEIARNFREGHGLVLSRYEIGGVPEYRALTKWPPLYPLTIALWPTGATPIKSAAHASVFFLGLTAALVYALLRRRTGELWAALAALLVLMGTPSQAVFAFAWSETLALPLIMLVLFAADRCLDAAAHDDGTPALGALVVLTLAATALVYTRYIGIAFGALIPLLWLRSADRRRSWRAYLGVFLVYGLATVMLLGRNYARTGYLGGVGWRGRSTMTLSEVFADVVESFLTIVPNSAIAWCGAIGVALIVWIALASRDGSADTALPGSRAHDVKPLACLAVVACVSYLLALVALRLRVDFDPIDLRLIVPAFPPAVIILILSATIAQSRGVRSPVGAGVLILCLTLCFAVASRGVSANAAARAHVVSHGTPVVPKRGKLIIGSYTRPVEAILPSRLLAELAELEDPLIVTNRPAKVAFWSGFRTKRLPQKGGDAAIRAINSLEGATHLVLLDYFPRQALQRYFAEGSSLDRDSLTYEFHPGWPHTVVVHLPLPVLLAG